MWRALVADKLADENAETQRARRFAEKTDATLCSLLLKESQRMHENEISERIIRLCKLRLGLICGLCVSAFKLPEPVN